MITQESKIRQWRTFWSNMGCNVVRLGKCTYHVTRILPSYYCGASHGLMQHAGWHRGPGTQVGMSLGRIIVAHMAYMQSTHQPASLHAHISMPDCLNCSRQIQRAIMIISIRAGDLKPLLVAPCKLIESTANPFLTNLRTSLKRSFPTLTHPTYL